MEAATLPFLYLGLPVGALMNRFSGWKIIIEKFKDRLASWKIRLLSIGGRSMLLKSVMGSLGIYYMSLFRMPGVVNKYLEKLRAGFFWGKEDGKKKLHWIKWNGVLANKTKGGLDIGSLEAFNKALLFKWKWRFLNNNDDIWCKVLKTFHGREGGFGHNHAVSMMNKEVWVKIIGTINQLHDSGIIAGDVIKRVIGDGNSTLFWQDQWIGDVPLMEQFHRLYMLELNKDCTISQRWNGAVSVWAWSRPIIAGTLLAHIQQLQDLISNCQISNSKDRWVWNLDVDDQFTVSEVRRCIDDYILPEGNVVTRWNKFIPIKVNIFNWRVRLNRLPTRLNLDLKGLDIPSILCGICNSDVEDNMHLFISCQVVMGMWRFVERWCNISIPVFIEMEDVFQWINTIDLSTMKRAGLDAIIMIMWWLMWKFRNDILFGDQNMRRNLLVDRLIDYSYTWFVNRNKRISISRVSWMLNPLLSIPM